MSDRWKIWKASVLVLSIAACSATIAEHADNDRIVEIAGRSHMHLHIQLRDGFKDDTVTLTVNGVEQYHRSGITTDLTISHADSIELLVSEPSVTLGITLARGLAASKTVQADQTPYVDVWIRANTIEFRESHEQTPLL
jgi:hypothetical protein